jgi:myosin heavy subunit
MFVFQEDYLEQILDTIITNMIPQRSPSQKPVPANIIFLGARYAHYHATHDLLASLLVRAMDKINEKVERCQWDMTILAFWMSNATLLLHYLKKDPGLMQVTTEFQAQLSELIHEIYILIIRDAERRMDRVLEIAMLDHETIPGFEDVAFANDWKIFKSKSKVSSPNPMSVKPSAIQKAQPSPRNITSLLSSALFVLDLYDVHSIITTQILSQLFYWLGAELFNRILNKRKYLARTKAMQIRMNISALEDWARNNNRTPEHYENGSLRSSGETTIDAARRHLAPVIQLLQWLQCFSSLGEDLEALDNTLKQMTRLTPEQLLRSSNNYRCEVGEKGLSKSARRQLQTMHMEVNNRRQTARKEREAALRSSAAEHTPPQTPTNATLASPRSIHTLNGLDIGDDDLDHDGLLMDPTHMLQFSLPTSVDLRLSYGGGYGGVDRERERKYIPSVPPEFLSKLDPASPGTTRIDRSEWERHDSDD